MHRTLAVVSFGFSLLFQFPVVSAATVPALGGYYSNGGGPTDYPGPLPEMGPFETEIEASSAILPRLQNPPYTYCAYRLLTGLTCVDDYTFTGTEPWFNSSTSYRLLWSRLHHYLYRYRVFYSGAYATWTITTPGHIEVTDGGALRGVYTMDTQINVRLSYTCPSGYWMVEDPLTWQIGSPRPTCTDGVPPAPPPPPPNEYTINVTLFIPANYVIGSPQSRCGRGRQIYFLGDNRTFSPTAGTYRGRQLVTVIPDATDADGLKDGTTPLNLVSESRAYAPDAIADGVIDAADNDGVLDDCHLLHERDTASNENMHIEVSRLSATQVRAHLFGGLGNPLVVGAPTADWDFTITIDASSAVPSWTLHGIPTDFRAHDGFPAYEIYINNQLIYAYDPGPPPYTFLGNLVKLFRPLDVTVNTSGALVAR